MIVRNFWQLYNIERGDAQSKGPLRQYLPSSYIHYCTGRMEDDGV